MITLYGSARTRAARCLWMLEECGVAFEHHSLEDIDLPARAEAVRPINPIGKVPALEDGDTRLFESMAINLYLARRYGGDLWPDEESGQARATAWSIWGMTELEPPLAQLFFERVIRDGGTRDRDNEARSEQALVRPMTALDNELAGLDYLVDGRFTVADLNLAAVLTLSRRAEYPLGEYPLVERWLGRCFDRPAFRRSRPA